MGSSDAAATAGETSAGYAASESRQRGLEFALVACRAAGRKLSEERTKAVAALALGEMRGKTAQQVVEHLKAFELHLK